MPCALAAAAGALPLALIAVQGGMRWNDNLGEMTPIPASALLARDHAMRQRFGAPDVRYLISVTGDTAESALARTEALERQLPGAQAEGLHQVVVGGDRHAAQCGGPGATAGSDPCGRMCWRRASGPPAGAAIPPGCICAVPRGRRPVAQSADAAPRGLHWRIHRRLRREPPGEVRRQWRSVVFLTGLRSPGQLAAWLRTNGPGAELVDLKAASESLVGGYRSRLLGILAGALVVIAALMAWATGSAGRFVWSAGTVTATVAATAGGGQLAARLGLAVSHGVAGAGGRARRRLLPVLQPAGCHTTEFRDTRHAVMACAASTIAGFAILGTSSIPLLAIIGTTVAIGTGTLFLAARFGCRAA